MSKTTTYHGCIITERFENTFEIDVQGRLFYATSMKEAKRKVDLHRRLTR